MKYLWLLALPLTAAAIESWLRIREWRRTRWANLTDLPREGDL